MTQAGSRDEGLEGAPRPSEQRRVVLRDVARVAGVSHQTVSRVLNKHPYVAHETRDRVLAAIWQLGYRPHAAARALALGHTQSLAVITSDPTAFGPASTLRGISAAATAAGWTITITELHSADRDIVRETVQRVSEQSVDGIISIAPYRLVAEALLAIPHRLPMTTIDASPEELSVDEHGGAAEATRHLLRLGHRTVFHISGPREFTAAEARIDGWRAALVDAGAEVNDVFVGQWTAASGYEQGRRIAALPAVTAVFAANDQMALGAMRALQEAGRRVPEDVSVVGFDDIPEAAYLMPPLTTMHIDFSEIGRRALALMFDQISNVSAMVRPRVTAELMVRRSSGPPPPVRPVRRTR